MLNTITLGLDIYQFDAGAKPRLELKGPPDNITLFPIPFIVAGDSDGESFQYNRNTTTMKVKNWEEQKKIDALPDPSINVIALAISIQLYSHRKYFNE